MWFQTFTQTAATNFSGQWLVYLGALMLIAAIGYTAANRHEGIGPIAKVCIMIAVAAGSITIMQLIYGWAHGGGGGATTL